MLIQILTVIINYLTRKSLKENFFFKKCKSGLEIEQMRFIYLNSVTHFI